MRRIFIITCVAAAATLAWGAADDSPREPEPTPDVVVGANLRAIVTAALAEVDPSPPPLSIEEEMTIIRERARAAEEARAEAERLAAEEAHRRWHEEQDRIAAEKAAAVPAGSVWDRLAACESQGEWDYGPHSGWGSGIFEGGLQFHPRTWDAYKLDGYPSAAYEATREMQIAVAELVLADQGWGAWPACSRKLGLR